MSDGTSLSTDLYRSEADDPRSTVLIRTPYSKDDPGHANTWINISRAVENGWAVVVQDVRGRFRSGGDFVPFVNEADDGVDTIAWIRKQPWSDGNIGMVGGSYAGLTQWLAASRNPQGLIGIVPAIAADDVHSGWLYEGDNLEFGFLSTWASVLVASTVGASEDREQILELVDQVNNQRVENFDQLVDMIPEFASYVSDWRDCGKSLVEPALAARTGVPAFIIGGWFDVFARGSVESFTRRVDDSTRPYDKLLVGPWAHGAMDGWFPLGRNFGPTAAFSVLDPTGLQLEWLKAIRDGSTVSAEPVTVFVGGANKWRTYSSWPPEGSDNLECQTHLADSTFLNVNHYKAVVAQSPVPTLGGRTMLPGFKIASNAGPLPLAALEQREDVLVFDTELFEEDTEIIGNISCDLAITSSGATTVAVTLGLVDATGTSEWLADGSDRISGGSECVPITVDLGPMAVRLASGTRLRVYVAASDFPRLEDGPRCDLVVQAPGPKVKLCVIPSSGAAQDTNTN